MAKEYGSSPLAQPAQLEKAYAHYRSSEPAQALATLFDDPAHARLCGGRAREFIEQYVLKDGRRINLLAEGRLVNLAAAEGHPASVMDMSFANQALSLEYLLQHSGELEKKVYGVPEAIDREIARLKLEAMGIQIDVLTEDQRKYLASWEEGT